MCLRGLGNEFSETGECYPTRAPCIHNGGGSCHRADCVGSDAPCRYTVIDVCVDINQSGGYIFIFNRDGLCRCIVGNVGCNRCDNTASNCDILHGVQSLSGINDSATFQQYVILHFCLPIRFSGSPQPYKSDAAFIAPNIDMDTRGIAISVLFAEGDQPFLFLL